MLSWSTALQSGCETYKCYVAYGWINTAFIPINNAFSRCRIVRWAPGASWPQPERRYLAGEYSSVCNLAPPSALWPWLSKVTVTLQRPNSGTYFMVCLWANKHYSLSDWPQGGRRGSPKTSAEGKRDFRGAKCTHMFVCIKRPSAGAQAGQQFCCFSVKLQWQTTLVSRNHVLYPVTDRGRCGSSSLADLMELQDLSRSR